MLVYMKKQGNAIVCPGNDKNLTDTIAAYDPRVWWKFNETSGNIITNYGNGAPSYNGTETGQVLFNQPSIIPSEPSNPSFFFPSDTSTDTVYSTSSTAFNVTDISIMMAVQVAHTGWRVFARRDYTSASHRQFSIEGGSNYLKFKITTTSSTTWREINMTGIPQLRDGNPHLIGGIYDNSAGRFEVWVDGVYLNRSPYGNLRQPTGSRMSVGQALGFSNSSLNGYVDNFAFWNRALTREEMERAYCAFMYG